MGPEIAESGGLGVSLRGHSGRGSSRALALSGFRADEPKWRREARWAGVCLSEEIDSLRLTWQPPNATLAISEGQIASASITGL